MCSESIRVPSRSSSRPLKELVLPGVGITAPSAGENEVGAVGELGALAFSRRSILSVILPQFFHIGGELIGYRSHDYLNNVIDFYDPKGATGS